MSMVTMPPNLPVYGSEDFLNYDPLAMSDLPSSADVLFGAIKLSPVRMPYPRPLLETWIERGPFRASL